MARHNQKAGKNADQRNDGAKRPPFRMSHPKPIVPRGLVAVFAACLVVIIAYGAVLGVMHQRSMYDHITDPALRHENARVIAYLDGPLFAQSSLDFLTPAESSHMTDVKRLLDILFLAYLFGLGIVIGTIAVFAWQRLWQRFDELLGRSLRAAGWTILGACLFCGAAAALSFPRFWALFHALLFPQGNWTFPYDSTLITLYPQQFFATFALRLFLYMFSAAFIMLILSAFMLRMRAAEHHFNEAWERKNKR